MVKCVSFKATYGKKKSGFVGTKDTEEKGKKKTREKFLLEKYANGKSHYRELLFRFILL